MKKYKIKQLFADYEITGINFDSKKVKEGNAFFAIKGESFDGNQYIDEALNRGAKLAFSDSKLYKDKPKSKIIYVDNIRDALTEAAEVFYPETPKNLIAVTGTNGKTSVVSYCQQLFALLGEKSASVGTVGVQCSEKAINDKFNSEQYKSLTTADILTFRQVLSELAQNNINSLAFEASSHGIEQQRMGRVQVQAAAFTSFSQDHLDYHKTMEQYLIAKLKLFTEHLQEGGLAVISSEIPEIGYLKDFLTEKKVNYLTVGNEGDIKIHSSAQSVTGQEVVFSYRGKEYNFNTEIIGSFQASNLLIAAMLIEKFGFSFDNIIDKIPHVKAVKGRLDRVTEVSDMYQVFVDYAHTPASLEKALVELGQIKGDGGRLIVVFGCGGNRDAGKRPQMGKVAKNYADVTIVTDDNPRFEIASEIRKQILAAVPEAMEIGDRKEAIFSAVNMLEKDDMLLIAGKGHEDYQIIEDKKIHMDDIEIALKALENKK